jgi:hypothetical protein
MNDKSLKEAPLFMLRDMATSEVKKKFIYFPPDNVSLGRIQSYMLCFDKEGQFIALQRYKSFRLPSDHIQNLTNKEFGIWILNINDKKTVKHITINLPTDLALTTKGLYSRMIFKEYNFVSFFDIIINNSVSAYVHNDGKTKVSSISLNLSEDTLYISGDRFLTIWNLKELTSQVINVNGIENFYLSPDGLYGVYFTEGIMHVIDLITFKKKTFHIESGKVISASFSPKGRHILVGFIYERVCLYDIFSGTLLIKMYTYGKLTNVDFNDDGVHVLVVTDESLMVYRLCYHYNFPGWKDWDDGALAYIRYFMSFNDLDESSLKRLTIQLQNRGYGYLRIEGVKKKIKELMSVGDIVKGENLKNVNSFEKMKARKTNVNKISKDIFNPIIHTPKKWYYRDEMRKKQYLVSCDDCDRGDKCLDCFHNEKANNFVRLTFLEKFTTSKFR